MMGFLLLTASFTLAILLSGVITTVVMIKLMGNAKFVKWLTGFYMKQIEQTTKAFEDIDFEEVGV